MNDKNFDSLKNLEAPDSWIENALNIPKAQEQKPIFFLKYSRHLMAVACLVLVCTVSLLIVFNKDENDVLVADPNFSETYTEQSDSTQKVESGSSGEKNQDKENNSKKPASFLQSIFENFNGGAPHESTENTEKPTQATVDKTENKNETQSATKPAETKPLQTDAVEKPTLPENDKVFPTDGEIGSPEYPGSPERPDDKPQEPSTPGVVAPSYLDVSYMVDADYLTSSETLYVAVTDPSGNIIISGVEGMIFPYNDKACAYFSVPLYSVTKSGQYGFHLYSSNGYYIKSYYYDL